MKRTARKRVKIVGKRPAPSASMCIQKYFHCGRCLTMLPEDKSPRDWAQLEVGATPIGLQIWCKRHDCNVAHIDFEGQVHPANLHAEEEDA